MGALMSSSEEEPEPGDLIEISRSFYNHWALYIGDGNVVHLTGSGGGSSSFSSSSSSDTKKAVLKKEPLDKVVGWGTYHINNKYDQIYDCRPVEEILRIAEAIVGKEVNYNVFAKNCEHFVTWLRYQVPRSEQAEAVTAGLSYGLSFLIALITS